MLRAGGLPEVYFGEAEETPQLLYRRGVRLGAGIAAGSGGRARTVRGNWSLEGTAAGGSRD